MINIRHIDKNGLSFDCPDYYDIGKYPSSDEAHKSIVALSKKDRKCELYIMVYRKSKFDSNAKGNTGLLEQYLRLQKYNNITTNKNLPYCFNANVYHNIGTIKTTISFDFNHDDVIMIVGNVAPSSNYNCIEDMKIILDTLHYDNNIIKRLKRKITSKNKTIIGLIAILINFSAVFISNYYDILFAFLGSLPAIFLIVPLEKVKSSKILSIITLFITIPIFLISAGIYYSAFVFLFYGDSPLLLAIELGLILLILLLNIFCALLLWIPTGSKIKNNTQANCPKCGNHIDSNAIYCNNCGNKIDWKSNGIVNKSSNAKSIDNKTAIIIEIGFIAILIIICLIVAYIVGIF